MGWWPRTSCAMTVLILCGLLTAAGPSATSPHKMTHKVKRGASSSSSCRREGVSKGSNHSHNAYLAMCLIVKQEHDDLVEWVEHYLKLGVGRIYIFDHDSSPPMVPLVADLALLGVVVYHYIPSDYIELELNYTHAPPSPPAPPRRWVKPQRRVNSQIYVYRTCLQRYRHRHQWMAFFDIDEFLLLKNPRVPSLPMFLKDFEPYGGLAVHWDVYGSSGHMVRPSNGSILSNYWKCMRNFMRIKSIVNTCHVLDFMNPHHFHYNPGYFAVNENFQFANDTNTSDTVTYINSLPPSSNKIVLNHYLIKSFEESLEKTKKGGAFGGHRGTRVLQEWDALCSQNCTDSASFMQGRVWYRPLSKWRDGPVQQLT